MQELNRTIERNKDEIEKTFKAKDSLLNIMARSQHNVNHEIRQLLYEYNLFDIDIPDEQLQQENDEELNKIITSALNTDSGKLKNFMTFFMSNVKNVFDALTDDDCSVHISIICDDDPAYVVTLFRDPTSYTERTNVDLKYPRYRIESFTPYKYIMNKRAIEPTFLCNDCSNYDNYCDRNDNWKQFYNACVSVPIRVRINKSEDLHNQIGFITVDNYKGFKNNEQLAINELKSFADSIFMIFESYLLACEFSSQLQQNNQV
ncbi:hypothetical protein [Bacteroides acidifaciens]|uniref:hypothetical protein n=1 Tax=Bacteroides acidifaciens TaxID=85831 RepID=UPI002614E085|nr:hypothetical protein [Bacteroides acidifaciens]